MLCRVVATVLLALGVLSVASPAAADPFTKMMTTDTTPPVAELSAPVAGSDVPNTVTVTGTVTDETAAGFARLYVRNNSSGQWLQPDGLSFGPYAGPVVVPTDTNDPVAAFSYDLPGDLAPGPYYVVLRSRDLAGNNSVSTSFDTVVFNVTGVVDTTPPAASISLPDVSFGDVSNPVSVTGEVVDETASGSVRVYLRQFSTGLWLQPDGSSFGSYSGAAVFVTDTNDPVASFSADLPELSEGLYYAVVRGTDLAGNNEPTSSFDSIYFNVINSDTTPPTAAVFVAPVAGTDVPNTVTVTGTVTDETAAGFARLYVRNNTTFEWLQPDGLSFGPYAGPVVVPTDTNDPVAAFSYDLPGDLVEGSYYMVLRGRDLAGNNSVNTSFDTVVFNVTGVVDTTAPVSEFVAPVAGTDVPNTVTVTGTVTDETAAGFARLYVRNNTTFEWLQPDGLSFGPYAGPVVVPTDTNDPVAAFSYDLPGDLVEGSYYMVLRGRDLAGNNEPGSSFDTVVFNVADPVLPPGGGL